MEERKPAEFVLPEHLKTPAMDEAWKDFVEHRRLMKKKLTHLAAKLIYKKFERWGAVKSVLAMYASIEGGWTSVWEPKGVKNSGQFNGAATPWQRSPQTQAKFDRELGMTRYMDSLNELAVDDLLAVFNAEHPDAHATKIHRVFREWAYDQKMKERAA